MRERLQQLMLLTLMHRLWSYSTSCADVGGVSVHVHGHVGALCGVQQEIDGPCEGFIHVEEIIVGSFGVYEVSDCI